MGCRAVSRLGLPIVSGCVSEMLPKKAFELATVGKAARRDDFSDRTGRGVEKTLGEGQLAFDDGFANGLAVQLMEPEFGETSRDVHLAGDVRWFDAFRRISVDKGLGFADHQRGWEDGRRRLSLNHPSWRQ